MAEVTTLIPLDNINPTEVFIGGGVDVILKEIERKATESTFDVETARGRKDIASMAYKVARSKTVLDDFGKALVSKWKEDSKKVDVVRKQARDFLEDLQAKVRQPLTDFEMAEDARIAKEKADAELLQAWTDALAEDDLFNRQKAIEAKEAEFAKIEAERKAKEDADRIAKEQAERDERIRKEAEAKAKHDAEEAVQKAKEASERAERERLAAIESAKREAELAEQRRIEAEKKAKEDQERAVKAAEERAKKEAEAKERERLAAEARAKAEADRIAANREHQAKINKEAMADFIAIGFDDEHAKAIVVAIAQGKIRNVKIQY